ncbi:MAG: DUF2325 domain-containing protein [Lachnospiraceae bacterium]|nr:DUF2325 domain-containing protein [Lachnospiraceae bacterium]
MSIVILGGNECMVRRYKELCEEYGCHAKIFAKPVAGLRDKIGDPDLIVFFTGTMSHKMLHTAMDRAKGTDIKIARTHSSSIAALRTILDENVLTA